MAMPKCPHCKYEFDSDDVWTWAGANMGTEFPTESDGDTTQTHCLSCKIPLRIELSLEPSWRFMDENNEELEDQNRQCKECNGTGEILLYDGSNTTGTHVDCEACSHQH